MAQQGKQRRIRVRGRQREGIDLDLLIQALLMIGEDRAQRQAPADANDSPPGSTSETPA